ncbi:MAG: M24 family metallopeptidase [Planctomycetaceae bacterium]
MRADRFAIRREKLVRRVLSRNLTALLVSDETNVSYLTGFTGDSSLLLLGSDLCLLVSDGRYATQIHDECPGLEAYIRPPGELLTAACARVLKKARLARVGIEGEHLTLAQFQKIEGATRGLELVPTADAVEELRQIKDAGEVAEIRKAIRLAERGFEVLKAELRGELSELEVAHSLEHTLRTFGARGCSFPPIVAVGSNAALPHARPSTKLISEGEFVLVDWGAEAPSGYRSDLTRILATDKLSPKLERVYGVVLKAQRAALRSIHPGVKASEVDTAARRCIEDAGFGKHFTHSLGHGIGLNTHEGPRLGGSSESTLKAGMVVTVEPGVYIEGWGGVRIEDDVLVTRRGYEVLSSAAGELEEVVVG